MANTNIRDAQQRALAKLAERRQQQDQLIDAVASALVTREEATAALAAADASLADALVALAELGIGREELAGILEVQVEQLGGKTRGRPRRGSPRDQPERPAGGSPAGEPPAEEPAARPPGRPRKARATSPPEGS